MNTQFNYYELKRKGKTDEGILILTYCLTKSYGSRLSIGGKGLMEKLKINQIPRQLFSRGYLRTERNGIYNTFLLKEPQSYFNNDNFLYMNIKPKLKVYYLYILGQRRIHETFQQFPEYYLPKELRSNPLILNAEGKIYLTMEKRQHGN